MYALSGVEGGEGSQRGHVDIGLYRCKHVQHVTYSVIGDDGDSSFVIDNVGCSTFKFGDDGACSGSFCGESDDAGVNVSSVTSLNCIGSVMVPIM